MEDEKQDSGEDSARNRSLVASAGVCPSVDGFCRALTNATTPKSDERRTATGSELPKLERAAQLEVGKLKHLAEVLKAEGVLNEEEYAVKRSEAIATV